MSRPGSIEPGAFVRHTQPGRTGQLVDRYRVALVRAELAELAASPAWELEQAPR